MRPGREALTVRFVEALAGCGWEAPLARLPSVSSAVSARFAQRLSIPFAAWLERLMAPFDRAAAAIAARPLPCLALLILCLPLSRLLLPAPIAGGVAAAAFGGALLVLALGWASRLYAEAGPRRVVLRLVLAGALVRVLFAALITWRGGFPDETTTYFPLAADAARNWSNGTASVLSEHLYVANRASYFYGLGGAFFLTGPSLWTGRLLGAAIGLFGALAAGEVARALGGGRAMATRAASRAAVFAVGLLALHPEHAFWNATVSRDGLSTLLILTALAVMLRAPGRLLQGRALWVLPTLGLLWWNSFLAAGWLGVTLGGAILAEAVAPLPSNRSQGGRVVALTRQLGAVTLAIAAVVWFGHRYGSFVSPETLTAVRTLGIGGRADFLPDAVFTTWTDVFLHLPAGSLFVLGAPLPWNAVHAHRAAYALLAVGGWAITGMGVIGVVALVRAHCRRMAPLLLFMAAALGSLALLEGMDGIVVRHRLPLTAVLACCAAVWLASATSERGTGDPQTDATAA